MFLDIFRRSKRVHKDVRYVAATRSESREAANKRATVQGQLAAYTALMSRDQIAADNDRFKRMSLEELEAVCVGRKADAERAGL